MNLSEYEQNYSIEIDFSQFDEKGYLKPSGYQSIANSIAERHLLKYNLNFEKLIETGLSWVLLSLTFDIVNPIKGRDAKLIGKTWYSSRKGILHRREITVQSEDGTTMFNCATISTLLDLEKRSIFKGRTFPFELMEPSENLLLEAVSSYKQKHEFEKGDRRLVRRSYIDGLGHVNNSRYSEFCFDTFDDDEANLENLHRVELYFASEMRLGQEFTTNRIKNENSLIIQGYNESEQKVTFYGVFSYK